MAFHVRCECTSDPRHGCAPRERALPDYLRRGVVVLDKPPGCTSRRAADRVEINRRRFSAGLQRLLTHAAFAEHAFQLKVAQDVALVRFFARTGCRSCGNKAIIAGL